MRDTEFLISLIDLVNHATTRLSTYIPYRDDPSLPRFVSGVFNVFYRDAILSHQRVSIY